MFIRLICRVLMYGAILGFGCGVWQSSTAILKSRRVETFQEVSSAHRGLEETPAELPTSNARAGPGVGPLQDAVAARVEAFERFRRESEMFWTRRYEAELAAAKERIERETEAAFGVAARVNASVSQEAVRTARTRLRVHYGEAVRVADRQAEADAAVVARISSRQAAADKEAAERIAKMQMEADHRAAELIVRQQAELNHRVSERIVREQEERDRPTATGRGPITKFRTTTSRAAPSSWDGQHAPVP